jgi:DNA polymerase elongation subunit (family B)
MELMDIILHQSKPVNEWIPWLVEQIKEQFDPRPSTLAELEPFIISTRLGEDYKSDEALGLTLATSYATETGTRPRAGTRLQYVVCEFNDGRRHNQCVFSPATFLKDKMGLSVSYYMVTQVQQSFKQVLDLHPVQFLQLEKAMTSLVNYHKFQVQRSRASRHWSK